MKLKLTNSMTVARWEFFKGVKSPMFLVMTFILPIFMLGGGLMSYMANHNQSEPRPMNIFYMASPEIASYISSLPSSGPVQLTSHHGSEAELRNALEERKFDAYFVIDDASIESGRVILYALDARDVNPSFVRQLLSTAISTYRLERLGYDTQAVTMAVTPISVDTRVMRDGAEKQMSLADILAPVIAGLIFIMAVMMSGQVLMYGVIKEKRNRVVEILLSSVSSLDLLIGKLIGFGALALLQMAIWVGAGLVAVNLMWDLKQLPISFSTLAPALLFAFFGYFLLATMFAALGSTMKDAEEGSHAQGLVVLVPILPLFVVPFIESAPNALWVRIMSHLPPFIPSIMLLRMSLTQLATWELVSSFVMLILSTGLFIYLGARIFEGGILQYERTVSFKDLRRMLRKSS